MNVIACMNFSATVFLKLVMPDKLAVKAKFVLNVC